MILNPRQLGLISTIVFRIGFASIFIVNAIVGIVQPDGFRALITTNIVGQLFPELLVSIMVVFIVINDFFTGLIILSGKSRFWIYLWAGMWLVIIAGIKLTNLIW